MLAKRITRRTRTFLDNVITESNDLTTENTLAITAVIALNIPVPNTPVEDTNAYFNTAHLADLMYFTDVFSDTVRVDIPEIKRLVRLLYKGKHDLIHNPSVIRLTDNNFLSLLGITNDLAPSYKEAVKTDLFRRLFNGYNLYVNELRSEG